MDRGHTELALEDFSRRKRSEGVQIPVAVRAAASELLVSLGFVLRSILHAMIIPSDTREDVSHTWRNRSNATASCNLICRMCTAETCCIRRFRACCWGCRRWPLGCGTVVHDTAGGVVSVGRKAVRRGRLCHRCSRRVKYLQCIPLVAVHAWFLERVAKDETWKIKTVLLVLMLFSSRRECATQS